MILRRGATVQKVIQAIVAGGICLGLASCSASVASAIRSDGGARITIQAEVPPLLSAKFRKLAASGGGSATGQLFDAAAIRASIAARPSLTLLELSLPSPDSVRAVISARSLDELALSPGIKGSGLIAVSRGAGWAECRLRIERGGAKAVAGLFPGIDPHLMEALSPPALEEDPVTADEYRTMLRSVLGAKAMPAMEAASLDIVLSAPGAVIGSGGGGLSGSILTAKLPLIDALALERPIEIWIRWKE